MNMLSKAKHAEDCNCAKCEFTKMPSRQDKLIRSHCRNFCCGLNNLEMAREVKLSIEMQDFKRAKYITEFLIEELEIDSGLTSTS